jgi:hypothetical protein
VSIAQGYFGAEALNRASSVVLVSGCMLEHGRFDAHHRCHGHLRYSALLNFIRPFRSVIHNGLVYEFLIFLNFHSKSIGLSLRF